MKINLITLLLLIMSIFLFPVNINKANASNENMVEIEGDTNYVNYNNIQVDTFALLCCDKERVFIAHGERAIFNYEVENIDNIKNIAYCYEILNGDNNVEVVFNKISNTNYNVCINVISVGEYKIKIVNIITLFDDTVIELSDTLFIYSEEDYDFFSTVSILDAKFYRYVHFVNPEEPNFKEYDEFYLEENNLLNETSINQYSTTFVENITVFGIITWVDKDGGSHNASHVIVDIIDDDPIGTNVLATTETNSSGYYSANVSSSSLFEPGTNDIKLRVSSQGGNVKVVNWFGAVYSITQNTTILDYNEPYLNLNFEINANNYLEEDDKERAYAFSVHQAMEFGAFYVESKEGSRLETVNVNYPSSRANSGYIGDLICIIEDDKNDWDVMLHEYAHYVQDKMNCIEISGGMEHAVNDCLNYRYGKEDGMRLAWIEGWANYFSISSQLERNASSFDIDNLGDSILSNINEITGEDLINCDIEVFSDYHFDKYGESDELCIAAALLDFADGNNELNDNISLGYTYLWNLVFDNQCEDFSDFVEILYDCTTDYTHLEYGVILSNHDIAPKLFSPNNNLICDWEVPLFMYFPNGGELGDNVDYRNNLFSIVFYDENKNFIYETAQTTSATYEPTDEEWAIVFNEIGAGGNLYWAVKSYQTTEYLSGPYYSEPRTITLPMPVDLITNASENGAISSEWSVNWFKFVVPTSGKYDFETTGTMDTYGELFSSYVFGISTANRLLNGFNDNGGVDNNFKLTINLVEGQVVYLRIRAHDWTSLGSYTIKASNHTHSYTTWKYLNNISHIESCTCGITGTATGAHVVPLNPPVNGLVNCLLCNHKITSGDIVVIPGLNTIGVNQVTVNGSYKLPNGIILLADEDMQSYFNGTLIFYKKDELPETE